MRAYMASVEILVIAEGVNLSGEHQRHVGLLRRGDGQVRPLLFADAAQPEQIIALQRRERKVIRPDSVLDYTEKVAEIAETLRLRLRHAVEEKVGRCAVEELLPIEASRQVQC